MRSAGFRFLTVGALTLLMFVPLFFAGIVVQDRKHYADSTRNEVGREWGGPQTVGGPILIVPVEGDIERKERIETVDRITGDTQYSLVTRRSRGPVDSLVLRPEVLSIDATTASQIRSRGIFQVPVYAAALDMDVTFDTSRLDDALAEGEVAQWDAAAIHVTLSNNAGLRGAAQISGPSGDLSFEPTSKGIAADLGDLRGRFDLSIQLDVNGTDRLMLTPVARDTTIRMTGDWPAPSFTGAFLPDAHDVTDEGFTAQWTIPHLARALPEVSRSTDLGAALGTSFVQVNDFYQKAWRTARYGILFIALTFLSVLLLERKDRPTHPVQYVLIGVAQCLFVLLMVAYAEQIGFAPAYALSAGATTGLITLFAWTGLKMGTRSFAVGGTLVALYGVLFLILRSADLALLAGATLAFLALTATVILTRNEDWYGPKRPRRSIWGRTAAPDPATPAP